MTSNEFVTQRCYCCKQYLPLNNDFFNKSSRAKSGYRNVCKQCRKNEHSSLYKKHKDKIKEDVLYKTNYIYKIYKKLDNKYKREFTLTKDWIYKNIVNNSCFYCQMESNGIDRIDNNIGHTIENSIPCCKECNNARMNNFTCEEFLHIGKAIREIKLKRLNNDTK